MANKNAFQEWMDSQLGGVGDAANSARDKANSKNDYTQNQTNQSNFNNLFSSDPTNFSITGSNNENAGRVEGLQRAKILTGQNPYEIGKDYQEAYGNIKKRSELSDTGSELLRANKAGAVADARNQLQSQGVKGGSAVGAVSQVERAKSFDVNNQLQQAQIKAQGDYLNAVKSNANFTTANEMNYGAMAAGRDVKSPNNFSSGFGTVICTELFHQQVFSLETLYKDHQYGRKILDNKPHVYEGYIFWAPTVVKFMKKSKLFSKLVACFAVPWAMNMAYDSSKFGKLISLIGEPLCGLLGKTLQLFRGEKYVRN